MLESWLRDLRHAARGLAARPTYAAVVVATLALVIGAASAVLSVVNATMVRPLPVPHSDRLVQLFLMPPGPPLWTNRNPLSAGTFFRFRERLQQAEAVEGLWSRERALGGDVEPETVVTGAVSAGLFPLLGGVPALGRTFTEDEDRANAKVVVLGHALWQRRFGGDTAIVGQAVLIDREPHEVIGVMPDGFVTLFSPTELWTPLNAMSSPLSLNSTFVQGFARLRPGVSAAQLEAEMSAALKDVIAEQPKVWTGWSPLVAGVQDAQFRLLRPSILALLGGMLALVLLAAANLANLTLAQMVTRRPELALRAALGGGRGAAMRLQVAETLLLAAAGGVAGVVVGQWSLPALLALDPALARTFGDVDLDWRVQLATAALTLTVALAAGLLPLVRELRGDLARGIADGNRRAAGSRRDHRTRAWLVGAECALAVVLLACGALLLSGFNSASRLDPGFDPRNVLGAQLRLSATAYPTEAARAALIARVLEQVRAVPGVENAGATLNRFVPGFFMVTAVHVEGQPTPDGQAHIRQFRRSSPGYFDTMRIPLLSGRDFSASDGIEQPPVAVVSKLFAEQHWPGVDSARPTPSARHQPATAHGGGRRRRRQRRGLQSAAGRDGVRVVRPEQRRGDAGVAGGAHQGRSAGAGAGDPRRGVRGRSGAADRLGDHPRAVPRRFAGAAALPQHAAAGAGRHRPDAGRPRRLRRDRAVGRGTQPRTGRAAGAGCVAGRAAAPGGGPGAAGGVHRADRRVAPWPRARPPCC